MARDRRRNNTDDGDDGDDGDDVIDDNRTQDVSRGATGKDATRLLAQLKEAPRSKEDKSRIAKYQVSSNRKERMKQMRNDDQKPDMSRLNDYQKRSMQKRMKSKSKAVKAKMNVYKTKRYQAAVAAADAEVVLNTQTAGLVETEEDMERTTNLSQATLKREHLDEQTSRHIFDLQLTDYSPYGFKYDRSGRSAILYGQRGHLALMDCHHLSLTTEFHVQERVRDACFLHNSTMFAAAQANHVYIYDDSGAEVHKLEDHNDPFCVDFLPYHWLLASVGRAGYLKYQDTSTGQIVSKHRTKLGACNVMRQNPSNAIMHLGHSNGVVTLWSPASSEYLVKMLCHKGSPIKSMAIDKSGTYMVTGGVDRQLKIWDLRMYKETHSYLTMPGIPSSLDISQRNVLGVGHGVHATFWKPSALKIKERDPYMHHSMPTCGPIETLRFRPFEDVCGVGHNKGIGSMVIPGSGEPNLDSTEYNLNPNQDTKQRREAEVRALLDKLDHNMITLNPEEIGGVEVSDPMRRQERLQDIQAAANAKLKPKKEKKKKRGRSKIQTQLRRKQQNVIDSQTVKLREAREKEKEANQAGAAQKDGEQDASADNEEAANAPAALRRFFQ